MNLDLIFIVIAHVSVLISILLIYPNLIRSKKSSLKSYKRQL